MSARFGSRRQARRLLAAGCLAAVTAASMTTAAAAGAASVPSAPQFPAAFSGGPHRLLVSWTAPASTGGASLQDYLISVSDADGAQWPVTSATAPASATTAVVGGLQPGVSYTVTVAAQNSAGTSPASVASDPATAEGPPDAPLDVELTAAAGDRLQASWQQPPGNGAPVTGTGVALYTGSGTLVSRTTVAPGAASVTFPAAAGPALPAGRDYYVQLRASNRFGTSGPTADSAVVTTSAAGTPAPGPVTAPPPFTISDYVAAADDTPAAMTTLGCSQAGAESGPQQGRSRLAMLDFGGQDGASSVLLIPPPVGSAPATELTYAQVDADAEAYATGYRQCTAPDAGPLVVGIATNNSLDVSTALGSEWAADVVNPAQSWAAQAFPGGEAVMAGSSDIEPGFGAASAARDWVAGYVSASAGNALYNIGSADGCDGTTMTGMCNNGWTVGDEYAVNAGLSTGLLRAVPEIYTESGIQAEQWQGISNAGPAAGLAPVNFAGELTEHGTCQIPGVTFCSGIDNTPAQGWDQLYQQLNSSPATAQQSLPWSSDITYSSVPSSAAQPGSSPAARPAAAGDGAAVSTPVCTAGQLAVSLNARAQYGSRPLTYYPFAVTNISPATCTAPGVSAVTARTHAGTRLDLAAGHGSSGSTQQRGTVLMPGESASFALGLSDTSTQCQYLRQFTLDFTGAAAPLTVPVTGITGGAAVCGDHAAVLTAHV